MTLTVWFDQMKPGVATVDSSSQLKETVSPGKKYLMMLKKYEAVSLFAPMTIECWSSPAAPWTTTVLGSNPLTGFPWVPPGQLVAQMLRTATAIGTSVEMFIQNPVAYWETVELKGT